MTPRKTERGEWDRQIEAKLYVICDLTKVRIDGLHFYTLCVFYHLSSSITPRGRKATVIQRPVDFYPLLLRFLSLANPFTVSWTEFPIAFLPFSLILHITIPYILGTLFTV